MADIIEQVRLLDLDGKLLLTLQNEVLVLTPGSSSTKSLTLEELIAILKQPILIPAMRVSVLNVDESVNYIIPNDDIIAGGLQYNEGYQNGDRRTLSMKLPNISRLRQRAGKYETCYPYLPSTNGLWYGTKIALDVGIQYQGQEYLFRRGVYCITSFDTNFDAASRDITYELKDKFCLFSGNTGVVNAGYEIPVETDVSLCIKDLLNLSCTDGTSFDIQSCVVDSKYSGFETQSTIRIDEGGHLSEIIDQLATQMSAEYYYNNTGNLIFNPIDDSMNDVNKPILWSYNDIELSNLSISANEDIVNVVKVTGTNVDNSVYSAVAKNTNLASPINIYQVKERRDQPVDNPNLWSDELAQQLADYTLRNKTMYQLSQTINVPFNPLLTVNNLIELTYSDLGIERSLWLIKNISYSIGQETMSVEICALDYLPFMAGRS